jgi:hypothetical protein
MVSTAILAGDHAACREPGLLPSAAEASVEATRRLGC